MKRLAALLCTLLCTFVLTVPGFAQDKTKIDARLDAARDVLNQIMATPDKQIPDSILRQATCVGVVPGMLKGAFVFGAEYGQGVVTCRTPRGWSAPVFIRMEGGSWGFQIGGQGTDLVLVAVNDKGFQDLLHSKFKIGADASAAAGPVGRNAQASTNWRLQSELLTWSTEQGAVCRSRPERSCGEPESRRHGPFLRRAGDVRERSARRCAGAPGCAAVCAHGGEVFPRSQRVTCGPMGAGRTEAPFVLLGPF